MVSISVNTMKPLQQNGQLSLFHASLLIYIAAIILIFLNMTDGVAQISDVDDRMRELQIRHLLFTKGQWFDFQLPFIAMPEPYFSPWSRLVDLPYVLFATVAGLFVAPDVALEMAFFTVPLLMLVPFSFLVALLLKRIVPLDTFSLRMQAVLMICITLFLTGSVQEFSPGRIDHHNVQILAMLLLACGLMLWSFKGGLLLGAGSAVSIVTGLECLPFIIVAWAGLLLSYLTGNAVAKRVLLGASAAVLVITVCSAFAFLGPVAMLSVQCDAFSAPYIVPMILAPLSIGASLYFTPHDAPWFVKTSAMIMPLVLVVAVTGYLFPQCLQGPYWMLGPLERELWLERLLQEKNFLELYSIDTTDAVTTLGLMTGLVFFLLIPAASMSFKRNPPYMILYAVMLCALVLALLMARYLKFPTLFIPFFVAFSVCWLREKVENRIFIISAASFSLGAMLVFAGSVFLFSKSVAAYHPVDLMEYDECQGQDMSVLATLSPGRIIAPNGLAMPLAFAMPEGFSIASAPFHRTAPGMRRTLQAFLSDDAGIRKQALAPFQYVAVCRLQFDLNEKDKSLYTALATGQDWPGLERIMTDKPSGLQVFRIDHARLQ